ncbi:unnamed protein product, partial [Musa acuminata subsp. burmannicoides]
FREEKYQRDGAQKRRVRCCSRSSHGGPSAARSSLPPIRSSLLFFPNLELGLRGVPLHFGVLAATPRRRPPLRMNKARPRKPSSRRFPVNLYPTVRRFTAIGTGDDEFVQSMVVAVESVIQKSIPKGRVSQEVSSRDKYVSANIGPIRVISSEQVQAVYNAMRRYDRMKYL